jgi:hypothetical protein
MQLFDKPTHTKASMEAAANTTTETTTATTSATAAASPEKKLSQKFNIITRQTKAGNGAGI